VPEIFLAETEDFYTTLYKRINENAVTKNINLLLKIVSKADELEDIINFSYMGKHGIMMLGQFKKSFVIAVEKLGLPLVCVDFYYDDLNLDSIVSNNYNAGYVCGLDLVEKVPQGGKIIILDIKTLL